MHKEGNDGAFGILALMTQLIQNKTPSELAGRAKDPLPKLGKAEQILARHFLLEMARDSDPVAALRLSLAAKQIVQAAWAEANVIDMALSTADISRKIKNLTTQRKAAEQGWQYAQFFLAFQYQLGMGVPSDLEQAKFWYRQAADQGNLIAQAALERLVAGSGTSTE